MVKTTAPVSSPSPLRAVGRAIADTFNVWVGPLVICLGSTMIHQRYHRDEFFWPAGLYVVTLLLATGLVYRAFVHHWSKIDEQVA